MAKTILTKDNKTKREIETPIPKCLSTDALSTLIDLVGEELVHKAAKDQFIIKFRAHIRSKLSATDSEGNPINSDEDILAVDYTDWKPEIRTRMTAEEKAIKALKQLPPEVAADILKNLQAQS